MMRANKFNYYEPPISVGGRPHCRECIHSMDSNGHRSYGIIKTLSLHDPDFAKLVCYCSKQDGYVKPYAWCDKIALSKAQIGNTKCLRGMGNGCDDKEK